ncbi:hypothetical protein HDV05_008245 [Chytridiales sp. JEL 0842]|nr:hypothetical protein HDV05_008245 [Chytridiales sp. JEL 0842]
MRNNGKPLKLRGTMTPSRSIPRDCRSNASDIVGQFNLLNFHEAKVPFYQYKFGLSESQVEAKIAWTAGQLQRMNASIVGFEEIFSLKPLKEAAKRAGYDMSKTTFVCPALDGVNPAVGLLSVYPVLEVQSFTTFPEDALMDFAPDDDEKAAPVLLPISKFSRPVLRVVIQLPTGHKLAVYVTHLKSKRPLVSKAEKKDAKANSVGTAISLVIRAAEAASLRCLLLDELAGKHDNLRRIATFDSTKKNRARASSSTRSRSQSKSGRNGRSSVTSRNGDDSDSDDENNGKEDPYFTTIVMGDLNDVTHAVTTEIISGTIPFKRLPYYEKEASWRTLLYSTNDVQARGADRDVNYTYIHNGRYECLDNILVSNNLVRGNPRHIGYVQWVQYFNDHLIDNTLAENDDDDDGPLTLPFAQNPFGNRRSTSRSPIPAARPRADQDPNLDEDAEPQEEEDETNPSTLQEPKTRPPKLKGKDVSRSDHGQVVALLKIFPKGVDPQSEYATEQFGRMTLGDELGPGGNSKVEIASGVKVRGNNSKQIVKDETQEMDDADLVADKYYASHHLDGGLPVESSARFDDASRMYIPQNIRAEIVNSTEALGSYGDSYSALSYLQAIFLEKRQEEATPTDIQQQPPVESVEDPLNFVANLTQPKVQAQVKQARPASSAPLQNVQAKSVIVTPPIEPALSATTPENTSRVLMASTVGAVALLVVGVVGGLLIHKRNGDRRRRDQHNLQRLNSALGKLEAQSDKIIGKPGSSPDHGPSSASSLSHGKMGAHVNEEKEVLASTQLLEALKKGELQTGKPNSKKRAESERTLSRVSLLSLGIPDAEKGTEKGGDEKGKQGGEVGLFDTVKMEKCVVELRGALKCDRPNPKDILQVALEIPQKMLPEVLKLYKNRYQSTVHADIDHEFHSGSIRKLLLGVWSPVLEYDATCLHEAMKGVGCDEDAIIELLVGRSNSEIRELKAAYFEKYKKSLESAVASEVRGYLRKLFVALLQGERDESNSYNDVEGDVEALYKAGVGRKGTDEMAFIVLLTHRSDEHLRKVFDAYPRKYEESIQEVIVKEFKGDLEKALLGLVDAIQNRHRYIAEELDKALKGSGHKEIKLIRLLVRHRFGEDLPRVKEEFRKLYNKTLHERLAEEKIGGDYEACLFTLVPKPF